MFWQSISSLRTAPYILYNVHCYFSLAVCIDIHTVIFVLYVYILNVYVIWFYKHKAGNKLLLLTVFS